MSWTSLTFGFTTSLVSSKLSACLLCPGCVKWLWHRLDSPETDAEMESGVQRVYLGSAPVKERGCRQHWAKAEVELRCRLHKASIDTGALGSGGSFAHQSVPHWVKMAGPLTLHPYFTQSSDGWAAPRRGNWFLCR